MATIKPEYQDTLAVQSGQVYLWEGLATGDTVQGLKPQKQRALAGSVQFTGTIGGATVGLQGSNDGTNWVTLKDIYGGDISFAAPSLPVAAEFTTSMLFIRPAPPTGGTSDDIDAHICLRG